MFEIRKLSFIVDEGEVVLQVNAVPFPFNELFSRWGTTPFIIVDAASIDREKYPAAQAILDRICDNGWTDEASNSYIPFGAGSGLLRNGGFVCADKARYDEIFEWTTIGINPEKLAQLGVDKLSKYMMLTISSVHPWGEVFSNNDEIIPGFSMGQAMPEPDPANFAVLPDIEKLVKTIVDDVEPRSYKRGTKKAVKLKITDGVAYYIVHDEVWSDEARAAFRKHAEAFTCRAQTRLLLR